MNMTVVAVIDIEPEDGVFVIEVEDLLNQRLLGGDETRMSI